MHQVLKDVRVLRWPAAIWLALIVVFQAMTVRLALVPVQPAPVPRSAIDPIEFTNVVLIAALVGLFAVIAVLLVQNDPAVGTTAFWFTRPVSLSTLVGAKLFAAVVLLVVIPLGTDIAAALAGGLTLGDAVRVVPGALVVQLAWLLPLLALGAITANLAQFVFSAVMEIIVFVSAVSLLRGVLTRRGTGAFVVPASAEVFFVVLTVALILLGLAALLFAYRTRSLRRAATALGVAPVAPCGLMFVWPWSWSFSAWRFRQLPTSIEATVTPGTLRIDPTFVAGSATSPQNEPASWWLSGALRFSNVPLRQVLLERAVRVSIDYGAERVTLGNASSFTTMQGHPDRAGAPLRALAEALGTPAVEDPNGEQTSLAGFGVAIPADVYGRHQYDSGILHADFVFIVAEEQITSAVPVTAGERYRASERSGTITAVSQLADGFSVSVIESRLRPLFAAPLIGDWDQIGYAARNTSLHLASLPARTRDSTMIAGDAAPIPVPARLTGSRLTFEFPLPAAVSPRDWMHGAEFVVIESRTLGDTVVHVTVPTLVLSSLRDITRPRPEGMSPGGHEP